MPWNSPVLLLVVSIVLNLISCSILRTKFCKNEVASGADLYLFNGFSSLLSAVTLIFVCAVSGVLAVPSVYTLMMGIVFGIATAVCAVFNMRALEIGPMSYTTVICYCSMLIPSLSGMVLYNETISVLQYAGVVFMIGSFVCAVDRKNDKAGASFKWFVFCMISFLASGAVGVMQKIHQNSQYRDELGMFLIIAFVVSALFSQVVFSYLRYRKKQSVTVFGHEKLRRFVVYSIVCGIGIALVNQLNMYLAGAMDAVIFYPVFNGAMILLTSLIGVVFWKERLSIKQWIGLIMGTAAILFLCLG